MKITKELHNRLVKKFGPVIDLKKDPEILSDIWGEVIEVLRPGLAETRMESVAPFGVSWLDSWVAHWVYNSQMQAAERRDRELATVLQSLVDLKFNERLTEIKRFVQDQGGLVNEPPDGGPPEPGPPPPAGPASFASPDGGSPEPPDGGPPEPGVPPGPEPEPPAGPDAGFLQENPWILYWFLSVKAPLLLDVIDAHITRRLNELQE